MRYNRIAAVCLIALLAFVETGCAGTRLGTIFSGTSLSVKNPVSNARFVDIEAAYGVALSGAKAYVDNYRNGHKCTRANPESLQNLCSRRSVVVQIQIADRRAQISLGRAKAFIQRNPTLDPTSVLDAAQTAVDALKAINSQTGA